MNILITRAKDESLKMADEFKKLGHTAIINPMIEINRVDNWFEDYQKIKDQIDLIIFTSKYAIKEFAAKEKDRSINLLVVGQKSFIEAENFGFTSIQVADGDARSLLKRIIDKNKVGKILYLSGENISLEIDKILFEKGINCTRLQIYKTSYIEKLRSPIISLLLKQKIELIIICSVLTAVAFKKSILKIKAKVDFSKVKLLVLSDNIANELKIFNFSEIFIYNNNKLLTVYGILSLVNRNLVSE